MNASGAMTASGEKMKMKTQVLLGKDKQQHQQKTTVRMNQPSAHRVGVTDAVVLTSKHEMKQSFVSTDTDLASSEAFQMKKA